MNSFFCASALAVLGMALLTGCNRVSAAREADAAVPQFSAKKGLLLPEQTRRALGMKLIEVTERKLVSTVEIPLRVYRQEQARVFGCGTLKPKEASQLHTGMAVEVLLPDSRKLKAKVAGVDTQLEHATGSVEVLVEIPGALESLAVGTFFKAAIPAATAGNVITIPRAAVLDCSEGRFVYTVSGEHLVRTAVQSGACDEEFVEITDGLYAGDQVVLQPVMPLWMTELAAVKGGQSCCLEPPRGK